MRRRHVIAALGLTCVLAVAPAVRADVADYLVSQGVAFRTAHEIVGGMVRKMLAEGKEFETLTPAEWKAYHPAFGDAVMKVVTAHASVRAKKTPQSTNPDAVSAQLAEIRQWLAGAQKAK